MNIIAVILLILGIISICYYGIIICLAGISSSLSFSFIWFFLGVCCIVISFIIKYCMKNEIILGKTWRFLIIFILFIGTIIFSAIEGTIVYHANQKAENGRDYLIVLGAQIKGTKITRTLKNRLDTAAVYLRENPNTRVITSGGKGPGEELTEAEAMKQYLVGQGIDTKRIWKEESSTDTYENITFSKKLIENQASVAIVTNGFHIYRAVSIAKKQGLKDVQGLAAPSGPVLFVNYYVREVFGVMKDKFMGNL